MKILPSAICLKPHPRANCVSIKTIEVQVGWRGRNQLELKYQLKGDLAQLRLPLPRFPQRAVGLWQHTCFEAFIKPEAGSGYYEFNFSPSSEWAVYAFSDYRIGGPLADDKLAPKLLVQRGDDSSELGALIDLSQLPTIKPRSPIRLGLSAVIEANDGGLTYWALTHPSDKPDFHHADSFSLELVLPDATA